MVWEFGRELWWTASRITARVPEAPFQSEAIIIDQLNGKSENCISLFSPSGRWTTLAATPRVYSEILLIIRHFKTWIILFYYPVFTNFLYGETMKEN